MKTHELKCWPEFFKAIKSGEKTFDFRTGSDRLYTVGDILWLREWSPEGKHYTGYHIRKQISYVMVGTMGLKDDQWILGLER